MIHPIEPFSVTGVVPVLANAGAAMLPAIVAGIATVASMIFKPRELIRVCKARPYIPVLVIAVGLGLYFGAGPLMALMTPGHGGKERTPSKISQDGDFAVASTDWTKVAIEIWKNQQRSGANALPPGPGTANGTADKSAGAAETQRYYRGGPRRTGFAGGPSPAKLEPAWNYDEPYAMFLSSPLLVENTVFGAWCILDAPDSYGGIFALDAGSGEELWLTYLKDPEAETEFKGIFSSPAVSEDGRWVVIGQGLHPDSNCELVCLDAVTGRVKWLVPTELHIESSPVVVGDKVIAGAGAIELGDDHKPISHPGFVFAVSLEDGSELWRYDVNDPESSPAVEDGIVYIGSGFNGNAVVALRSETDAELEAQGLDRLVWKAGTPYPATGAVTITEDLVIVGCGNGDYVFAAQNPAGAVLAFDKGTGEEKWRVAMPDSVLGAVAVAGGKAICAVRNGDIAALDLNNPGDILWAGKVNGTSPALAGPSFTGAAVYAVSADGTLAVFDAESGEVLEKHYLNDPGEPGNLGLSISSPFIGNEGRLYVGSETGGLTCLVGTESIQ